MAIHFNLADLIITITQLGYVIEISKFDKSLKINLSKRINNNIVDEYIITQVIPHDYIKNIPKLEKLFDFMMKKLDIIILDDNENNRPKSRPGKN